MKNWGKSVIAVVCGAFGIIPFGKRPFEKDPGD